MLTAELMFHGIFFAHCIKANSERLNMTVHHHNNVNTHLLQILLMCLATGRVPCVKVLPTAVFYVWNSQIIDTLQT